MRLPKASRPTTFQQPGAENDSRETWKPLLPYPRGMSARRGFAGASKPRSRDEQATRHVSEPGDLLALRICPECIVGEGVGKPERSSVQPMFREASHVCARRLRRDRRKTTSGSRAVTSN